MQNHGFAISALLMAMGDPLISARYASANCGTKDLDQEPLQSAANTMTHGGTNTKRFRQRGPTLKEGKTEKEKGKADSEAWMEAQGHKPTL